MHASLLVAFASLARTASLRATTVRAPSTPRHSEPSTPRHRPLRGALDDGDAALSAAVAALQSLQLATAESCVARAETAYESGVDDAATLADRRDLVASVAAQIRRLREKTTAARDEALSKRRATTSLDSAGDAAYREAAAALGRGDYAAARASVDAARAAFSRDGVAGRDEQLGALYASINAEEERAARDEARRAAQEAERQRELLQRGKERVADQRITGANSER